MKIPTLFSLFIICFSRRWHLTRQGFLTKSTFTVFWRSKLVTFSGLKFKLSNTCTCICNLSPSEQWLLAFSFGRKCLTFITLALEPWGLTKDSKYRLYVNNPLYVWKTSKKQVYHKRPRCLIYSIGELFPLVYYLNTVHIYLYLLETALNFSDINTNLAFMCITYKVFSMWNVPCISFCISEPWKWWIPPVGV